MYSREKSSDSAKYNNIIVIKRSTICAILAIDYISIIKNQEKDDDDSSVLSSVDSGEEGHPYGIRHRSGCSTGAKIFTAEREFAYEDFVKRTDPRLYPTLRATIVSR